MELWVAFAFGALVGTFVGVFVGRHRAAATRRAAPPVTPPPPPRTPPPAEREPVFRELGVKIVRAIPQELPMVACPMAQLTEMLMKLLDFSMRRLRDSQPPRELRIAVSESGPSLIIALSDSGNPLSVEADAVNRQARRLLLERDGHEVVAVENGLEAIERLGPASERFDAVVTDLQMPRLGGRALYEQLAEQRPQLADRFVFVTGDRARDETRKFLDECGQPSVMKPYDFNDLITAIAKVAGKR